MLLNIALVSIYFALVGIFVHNVTGGGGGILHKIFIGLMGYMLAEACRSLFDISIGVLGYIATDIAGAFAVEWVIERAKIYWILSKIRDSDQDD